MVYSFFFIHFYFFIYSLLINQRERISDTFIDRILYVK